MESKSEIRIRKGYIAELTDKSASKLVGRLLKRFEIYNDKNIIKKAVKELIYESFRDLRDSLLVGNYGLENTYWEFKKRP